MWVWTILFLVGAGGISWQIIGRAYVVVLFWIGVNQVRTLAAHRYGSDLTAPMSRIDQVLDTHTFGRGGWLPDIWAPLGMRYHALHHLLPGLPYHNLGPAHRRLAGVIPGTSSYRRTWYEGLADVLGKLFRKSAERTRAKKRRAVV